MSFTQGLPHVESLISKIWNVDPTVVAYSTVKQFVVLMEVTYCNIRFLESVIVGVG